MGPSLARRVRRVARRGGRRSLRVLAVARFSEPGTAAALERDGIETIACDLLDPAQVARLPRGSERALPRRAQVRLDGPAGSHLGPERDRARRSWRRTSGTAGSWCSRAGTSTRSCRPAPPGRPRRTRSTRWGNTRRPASAASASSSTPRASGARRASSSASSTPSTCATARSWTWRAQVHAGERGGPARRATSTPSGRATRTRMPFVGSRCARARLGRSS